MFNQLLISFGFGFLTFSLNRSQFTTLIKCLEHFNFPGESNPLQTCLNYTSPSAPDISETLSLFDSPYPPKRPKLEPAFFSSITDMEKEPSYTNGDSADCNISTLLNMGNTCFLNSVLYTLRFAPTFLHNLHHLLVDLSLINSKLKENKTKTSSLGRNGSAVSGSSWRSASSKDLLSIGKCCFYIGNDNLNVYKSIEIKMI